MNRTSPLKITIITVLILFTLIVNGTATLTVGCSDFSSAGSDPQESRRDRDLQPERLMDAIGVKPGMTVAEPGCGSGYFTFKLAKRVGETGKVYAEDIDEKALSRLEARRDREGFDNIVTILGEVEDPLLPEGELDLVIFVHAFHDFEKPVEFLKNLKPSLKPGATVVDVDIDADMTGEHSHFDTQKEVREYFELAGYELVRSEDFLEKFFVLIFRPRN